MPSTEERGMKVIVLVINKAVNLSYYFLINTSGVNSWQRERVFQNPNFAFWFCHQRIYGDPEEVILPLLDPLYL